MSTAISRPSTRREYIPTREEIARSVAEIQANWSEQQRQTRQDQAATGFRFLTAMIKRRELVDGIHIA